MNFGNVKEITIPEGNVKEIIDSAGKSLWKSGPGYIYLKLINRRISGTYTNETVESIGEGAFLNCYALTSVSFPVATSIGSSAFWNCSALTTIDFPAATSIGDNAFASCSALTTLILRSEIMATLNAKNAFNNTPIKTRTGYIYVPAILVDTYKTDTNWSTYANQIRAIEDYPEITGGKMA